MKSRKFITMSFAAVMAVSAMSMTAFSANEDEIRVINSQEAIQVYANGELIEFPDEKPFIDENDRTQVPVRAVSEMLKCDVDWNGDAQTVTIKKDEKSIKIIIGENFLTVNDEKLQMDTEAIIKGGRTFIPVRFAAEALGCRVSYMIDKGGGVYVNGDLGVDFDVTVNPHLSFDGSEDWFMVGEAAYRDHEFYHGSNLPSNILSKFEQATYDTESEIVDLSQNGMKEKFFVPSSDQLFSPESRTFKNANDVYVKLTPHENNPDGKLYMMLRRIPRAEYFNENNYQFPKNSVHYSKSVKISTTEISVFHFKDVDTGEDFLYSIGSYIDFGNEYLFDLEVIGE